MASSATVSTLRNRIRVQLEAAGGFTEPLAVTASSQDLAALRDRVEARLQDSGNLRWSTDDVDEGIRTALQQYSRRHPDHGISTITLSAAGREISISTITDLIRVEKVWWDYDSSTPGYPPVWRQFEVWPGSLLYIDDAEEPASGDNVRIWYSKRQTIEDLDSATATTFPAEDEDVMVTGGAYFCAHQRSMELAEGLQVDRDVVKRLEDWADERGKNFRYQLGIKPPAWQRYAYGYDQDDLDEAIRWALHRYSEMSPDRKITSVTLSAAGREVDISSVSGYIEIERVWWDYDSGDPEHSPRWRDFELWPGDILFINEADEPASGDVVRVWYTLLHTLNGLDSATATTIPADADTLIVTGATGYAAQERVQEQAQRSVPRKLREWADARLREFERGLRLVARRGAARHSGIAVGAALDRWDSGGGKWD